MNRRDGDAAPLRFPLQCSRPSTTCSRTAPSFRILAPIISIDALPRPRPDIWSPNTPNSDTRSSFSPWPRQPDVRRETQLACADRPGHTPPDREFLSSSLPAFGRPPWMKLSALPDLGYSVGAVGTKVGPSLVRQSPRVSWTRTLGRPPSVIGWA